jgi:hypothetical protein
VPKIVHVPFLRVFVLYYMCRLFVLFFVRAFTCLSFSFLSCYPSTLAMQIVLELCERGSLYTVMQRRRDARAAAVAAAAVHYPRGRGATSATAAAATTGDAAAAAAAVRGDAVLCAAKLRLATQCAAAVAFLHHTCRPPLLHGDVKSLNFLATDDLQVRSLVLPFP